jgi:hypothetical protein
MESVAAVADTAEAIAKVLEALPSTAVGIAAMAVAGLIALPAFHVFKASPSGGRQKAAKAVSILVLAVGALLFLLAGYILTIYQPPGQLSVLVRLIDESGQPVPASAQISGEIRAGHATHRVVQPGPVLTISGMSRGDLKTAATLVVEAPGYETASCVTNIIEDRQVMTVMLRRKTYGGTYHFRTVCLSRPTVGAPGVFLRLSTSLTTTTVVSDAQGHCDAVLAHEKDVDLVEAVAFRGNLQVGYVNLSTQPGLINVGVICDEDVHP